MNRCYNGDVKGYANYGGRGIVVCDEWKESFANFKNWAYQNGYNENLSIDRIDVNGNLIERTMTVGKTTKKER